ncbi:MAG: hypothetical protein BWZ10_02613 [candidate division BRC1 bacterium ADurb.BinA364]|nr:MAG: hypothetical protein BWZ10_02613 [candidate division BRC1 bacterium ADurb.BinA364]
MQRIVCRIDEDVRIDVVVAADRQAVCRVGIGKRGERLGAGLQNQQADEAIAESAAPGQVDPVLGVESHRGVAHNVGFDGGPGAVAQTSVARAAKDMRAALRVDGDFGIAAFGHAGFEAGGHFLAPGAGGRIAEAVIQRALAGIGQMNAALSIQAEVGISAFGDF